MHRSSTRRTFVKTAGSAGLGGFAFHNPLVRAASPNGKLNHACVGVNGMGWGDFHNFIRHPRVHIRAICDVDTARWDRAARERPDATKYQDWRELFDKESDRIDSVNVTVPDHMHAIISMRALQAGKHVYCQKPLCHDVAEVRAITQAAKKAGTVTQLGTQHASGIGDRMAVGFIKQGLVGKIKRVILCSNRPGAVERYRLKGPRPTEAHTPPATLNWDWWLGTAPQRGYAPSIYHPTIWRAWQDFGTGWSGDIGCHVFDAVWKGLGLQAPKSVVAEVQESWARSPARRADTWPQGDHITWVFPGSDLTEGDELVVEWFDGAFYPPKEIQALAETDRYPPESAMLIGTEGALLLPHTAGPRLLPRDKFIKTPRPKLPGRNHYHHFVDACLGGEMSESHFGQTGPMTEAILLGTVAIRVPGQQLTWDAANMKFPNAPAAERFLRRSYRSGWAVAGVA